ncbi:hypothetical protein ABTZ03_31005 [Kitasatospora sp. NPDC096077]
MTTIPAQAGRRGLFTADPDQRLRPGTPPGRRPEPDENQLTFL